MAEDEDRGALVEAWHALADFFDREDVRLYAQAAFLAWHVFSVLVMVVMGAAGRWPWWVVPMAGAVVVLWAGIFAAYYRNLRAEREAEDERPREIGRDFAWAARAQAMSEGFEAARHEDGPVFEKVEVCVRMARRFQRQKHGDEDHPDVEDVSGAGGDEEACVGRVCEAHGIPEPRVARIICERAFAEGRGAWAHILVEEVSEAVEAAVRQSCCPLHAACDLEHELYQVAAVAMAWAEHSRRRRGDGEVALHQRDEQAVKP